MVAVPVAIKFHLNKQTKRSTVIFFLLPNIVKQHRNFFSNALQIIKIITKL